MAEEGKMKARPLSWRDLLDIGEIKPLGPDDIPVLKEIRDVLAKHGALDRFGVTLQHKHFDLADDEMLVETTDLDNRTLTIKPRKKTEHISTIETAWKFGSDEEGVIGSLQCWLKCEQFNGLHFTKHDKW